MWGWWDLLALMFYLALLACLYWYVAVPRDLPPGPMGLPFIGSSLQTLQAKNQHLVMARWAKEYGPLYKVYIGTKMVVVLADHHTITEALVKQSEVFAGRPRFHSFQPSKIPHNHGIIFSDGDVWREHRQFASRTLRDFGLGRSILEPRIRDEVKYLIGELMQCSQGPVDVEKMVENAVSNIICVLLFGRRYDYKDETFCQLLNVLKLRANQSAVGFLSPFILCEWLGVLMSKTPLVERFRVAGNEFVSLITRETKAAMAEFDPAQDPHNYIHAFMKQQLAHGNDEKQAYYTETQLVAIGVELFAAGTETTANTIRWAILYLSQHQDIQDKMCDEIVALAGKGNIPAFADRDRLPFTTAVITETQRIANLVPQSVMHRTMADTKLLGYRIPADTLVIPLLSAVLTDQKAYPEPDRFDPYRFLDENGKFVDDPSFIPFSAGRRICLGKPLAKMELFLFITGIFTRFRFTPIDEDINNNKTKEMGSVGFTRIPKSFKVNVQRRL